MATLSWAAVEEAAPGDPGAYAGLAADFAATAADAASARSLLERFAGSVDASVWRGEAADAFRDDMATLPPKLAKLADSYAKAAEGMATYARVLEDLQAQARRLADQARAAEDERRAAQAAKEAATAADPAAPTTAHDDAIDAARRRTTTIERQLDHLADRRRAAEQAAVRALDRAHDLGIKNDPWYKRAWGAVDRWVDDHVDLLRTVSTGLKWISAAAGLLSFIPVLAPICLPIALATGGAALAMDGLLAASGHGSWTSFAVDAALMALPFAGRLVSRALRPGARALDGAGDVVNAADDAVDAGRAADGATDAVRSTDIGRDVDRAADAARAEERARRVEELASDPAHGGKVSRNSIAEAEAGQGAEDVGAVKGLRRDPSGAAEFLDEVDRPWDVKAFRSQVPPGAKGAFTLEDAMKSIRDELRLGENVIVDTRNMTAEHVDQLREAVRAAGEDGRVVFWP